MTNNTNKICAACTKAHNGVNGRFCNVLKCYVEYSKKPQCKQQ